MALQRVFIVVYMHNVVNDANCTFEGITIRKEGHCAEVFYSIDSMIFPEIFYLFPEVITVYNVVRYIRTK